MAHLEIEIYDHRRRLFPLLAEWQLAGEVVGKADDGCRDDVAPGSYSSLNGAWCT